MKYWHRFALGIGLGIIFGVLLPLRGGDTIEQFEVIQGIIINLGRYALFPLVFFSSAIAVYELWYEEKLHRMGFGLFLVIPLTTLTTVVLGTLTLGILRPGRIPIIIKEGEVLRLPQGIQLLERVFPDNMFEVFSGDGSYLLPILIAALLFGIAFHYPKAHAGPSLELFDSLSRLLFRITHYILEFMAFGMIGLSIHRVLLIRSTPDLDLFYQLFGVVGGLVLVIGFLVYPLTLYFLGGRINPLVWLRGTLIPQIAALFSGDSYFTLSFLKRFGKESHLIPRKTGSIAYPVSAVFGRAGTAMVICVSFLVILQSYSSLEITFNQYLWVMVNAFAVSFLLIGVPGQGVLIGLAVLSRWYGQGLEEGYLILLPAAPMLIAAGAVLDTITASLITTLTSRWNKMEMKPIQ